MKYILWCTITFFLLILPAQADESFNEEIIDDTTTTLENSTIETLANEAISASESQLPAQTVEIKKRSRSKWDFSDHSEDKKNKISQESKDQNKPKKKKFSSPKKLEDPKTTWTSPTSGKVRQSTYAN